MYRPAAAIDLPFPSRLEPWGVASFRGTREALRAAFGPPHYVETDPFRTAGGDEDNWAWELPGGQRVLVMLGVPYGRATLYCDPPAPATAIAALGLSAESDTLEVFPRPFHDGGPAGEARHGPTSRTPER